MNTKTTKFLAVLAVFAMAFAGLAVGISAEQNDAEITYDSNAVGTFEIPKAGTDGASGTAKVYTVSTVTGTETSTGVALSGYAPNNAASSGGYTASNYAAYSIMKVTLPEITNTEVKSVTISQERTDIALLVASTQHVVSGNVITGHYATATVSGEDYELLMPVNAGKVTLKVTLYDAALGSDSRVPATANIVGTATYVIDFAKVSTQITLADGLNDGYSTPKWSYASSGTALTFTDSVTANIMFTTSGALNITIPATKTVTLTGNAPGTTNAVIHATGDTNIATSDSGMSNLVIKQLNVQGYGINSSGVVTVGNGSSTESAVISVKTTGGSNGFYVKQLDLKGAEIDSTAGEKAINTTNQLTTNGTTYNKVVAKIDDTMNSNNTGTDKIFGIKVGASTETTSVLTINVNSTIITDGITIEIKEPGTHAPSITKTGKLIVKGDYTQTDYTEAYGVSGIVYKGNGTVEAKLINSESEAIAGDISLVSGAGSYGVTVKNSGTTVVQKTAATAGTEDTEPKVIAKVAELVTNCTNATITLKSTADVTSLDVSKLMENSTIAGLDSLTLIAGDNIKSITAAKDISVTKTKLTFIGFTSAVSGNFTNGTDSVQLASVTGTFGIYAGSVHIDGNITSGNFYIDGDADISGQLTGTLNLFKKTDATSANLEILDAFSIKSGVLNINDVAVTVDTQIKLVDAGTIAFKTGATFDSAVEIAHSNKDNANAGIVKSDVTFTKDLTISGTKVTIGSAITTSGALALSATTVECGYNITANGSFEVAEGSTVKISGASTSDVKALTVAGDASIAGDVELTFATLTLKGTTELSGNILYSDAKSIVTNSGTMTVTADGKTYKKGGSFADGTATLDADNFVNDGVLVIKGVVVDLTNNKTVRLYKNIGYAYGATPTKVGELVNDGTIYIMDAKADILTLSTSGKGTIDTSAVSEEVTISGSIITSGTTFSKYQIVTFTADTTVKKGADVTFKGNAIIPEGVTVTIENGALMTMKDAFGKLTNNGKIAAEGTGANGVFYVDKAEVINNGTIIAEYSGNVAGIAIGFAAGSKITNNSDIIINDKNTLANATANFINAKTGTITVYGDMTGTAVGVGSNPVINSGAVIINSEVNSEIGVSNAASGASVTITEALNGVTVNDAKFESTATTFMNGANSVVVAKGGDHGDVVATATYGGIVIASTTYKYDKTYTSATAMTVSGALTINSTSSTPANVDLTVQCNKYGTIGVTDALTLSEVDLKTNTATTELYVSGTLSIDDTCTFENDGIFNVPGTAYSLVTMTESAGSIWAALYEIPANATLGTKKTYVYTNVPDAVAGAIEAEVKTVTVTGEVDIEKDIVVPSGMTLKIDGAKVTIKEDIVVEIYTDGTTPAVLNSTGAITVEGKLVIDDVTKSKKGSGTIASEVILKSGNTEIYTTLAWAMADVGTEEATLTLCGATVVKKNTTIPENIIVDTNGNNFTVQDAELTIDGGLFLNGGTYTVTDKAKIVLNGAITKESKMDYTDGKAYPAGLYFSMNDSALYVIGNIADAETWAVLADGNSMTYKGDLKTSAIDFDVKGTLVFAGTVEAKTMDIGSNAKVTFSKAVAIDTVTLGVSTVTIKDDAYLDGTFVSSVGSISFNKAVASADSTITVATASDVTTMTLAGAIEYVLQLDDYQVATLGNVTVKADLFELSVGLGTTTIGKNSNIDYLEVYGDLVVDNGFKLTSDAAAIYGTLTANAATDTKAKATAEIDELYVGIAFDTSAVAAVYGDVTADVALVGAGSTVPEAISGMNYSTDVYVETAEVLTAYASSAYVSIFYYLADVDFDISDPNAKGPVWYDEDGDKVLTTATIGDYEAIYAVYDYNVYSVTIVTDAGVKSVAIGGIELVNTGGNVFSLGTAEDPLTPLTAGTYKVTYTLKSGYEGTAVLSTETGTILKDNSFTIMPGNESKALNFQLAGTEPTPEPEPEPTPTPEEKSEWTVTTILLCVLVVLIAIMAVIVALRLNRN